MIESTGTRDSSRGDETRYDLARNRARSLITLTRQRPLVDVQAIVDFAGIPVIERALPDSTRATIGDVAGRRSIILNRRWKFSSEHERRWVLAEELGHVLMGHKLVESTEPGKPTIGILEQRRVFYEREARAFAAELLMPFAEVRRRWFDLSVRGLNVEEMVRRLADEFEVTDGDERPCTADEAHPSLGSCIDMAPQQTGPPLLVSRGRPQPLDRREGRDKVVEDDPPRNPPP